MRLFEVKPQLPAEYRKLILELDRIAPGPLKPVSKIKNDVVSENDVFNIKMMHMFEGVGDIEGDEAVLAIGLHEDENNAYVMVRFPTFAGIGSMAGDKFVKQVAKMLSHIGGGGTVISNNVGQHGFYTAWFVRLY